GGHVTGLVEEAVDDAVQRGIEAFDALDGSLHELGRLHLPGPDEVGLRCRVEPSGVGGESHGAAPWWRAGNPPRATRTTRERPGGSPTQATAMPMREINANLTASSVGGLPAAPTTSYSARIGWSVVRWMRLRATAAAWSTHHAAPSRNSSRM